MRNEKCRNGIARKECIGSTTEGVKAMNKEVPGKGNWEIWDNQGARRVGSEDSVHSQPQVDKDRLLRLYLHHWCENSSGAAANGINLL